MTKQKMEEKLMLVEKLAGLLKDFAKDNENRSKDAILEGTQEYYKGRATAFDDAADWIMERLA